MPPLIPDDGQHALTRGELDQALAAVNAAIDTALDDLLDLTDNGNGFVRGVNVVQRGLVLTRLLALRAFRSRIVDKIARDQ